MRSGEHSDYMHYTIISLGCYCTEDQRLLFFLGGFSGKDSAGRVATAL